MTLEPDGDVWGGSRRPSRFVLLVPLRSIPNVFVQYWRRSQEV